MTDVGTIHSGGQPSVDSPILQGGRNNVKGPSLSRQAVFLAGLLLFFPVVVWAQGTSPWTDAVNVLETAFTGPIARGLSLIAIVVGGLMFAFGEGGSKKALAGIVFGLGMAMGAANFLAWLF